MFFYKRSIEQRKILNMEKTIEIKRLNGRDIIFLYTCEDNTMEKTLEKAVKENVDLSFANLSYRVLSDVNLSNANLKYASFVGSKLNKVNFNGANLRGTIFGYSELTDVDFTDADLRCADLYGTKITHEQLINVKGINDQCPKKGSFIGWKKCIDDSEVPYIVKLEIPADAKRSSSTTNKCRCSHAKVLEIQNIDGTIADVDKVYSWFGKKFEYKVNEMIYPDSFDDRYWVECSHGIHFFINREDAVNYKF